MNPSRHAWILFVALAACAASAARWEKPGATAATVQQDSEECRTQARLAPPPPRHGQAPSTSLASKVLSENEERERQDAENFQKCMREKGYSAAR